MGKEIKVLELFAGVGGFRIGLEESSEEVFKTKWANQWEPSRKSQDAFQVYDYHFKDSVNIGKSIEDITEEEFKEMDADMIVGGFPCFAEGTLITTLEGVKPIEEIKKGNKVLTHTNTFKKVVVPMVKRKKGIYILEVQGSPRTKVTEEHPFYVRERLRGWKTENGKRKRTTEWSEPKWVEAKDLEKGKHFIAMSENTEDKNIKNLTMEESWLLGRYVADGYIQDSKRSGRENSYNRKTIFTIGNGKVDEFKSKLDAYHATESKEGSMTRMIITSERLMELARLCGRGSGNKRIPGYIMDLPKELLKEFMNGYTAGDGTKGAYKNQYQANSISKELIYQLGQVVQKLYNTPYQITFFKRPKTTVIEGRTVNQKDTWTLKYYTKPTVKPQGHYIDGMLYMPIRSLEYNKDFDDLVYNFEVEEDNSYVANNMTVHNCQSYSVANNPRYALGIEGEKGVLFWDIVRATDAIKPKYLLLENVDRLLKSPTKQRGRDFAVMLAAFNQLGYSVEWRVINAAEYGRAQRRRRVFIFAFRNDLGYAKGIDQRLRVKESAEVFKGHIFKEGMYAKQFPIKEEIVKKRHTFGELDSDMVNVSDDYSLGNMWNAGLMHKGEFHTFETMPVKEEPITLGEIIQEESEVKDSVYLDEDQIERFDYLRGSKKIERETAEGHKYTYSEGGMSPYDGLDLPGRTMLTSEGLVNRSTHYLKVNERYRIITPIEAERMQDFPDDWTRYKLEDGEVKEVPDRRRLFFMGNALVTGIVKRLADGIVEIDKL